MANFINPTSSSQIFMSNKSKEEPINHERIYLFKKESGMPGKVKKCVASPREPKVDKQKKDRLSSLFNICISC